MTLLRRPTVALALAVLLGSLAACSDDEGSDGAATDDGSSTVERCATGPMGSLEEPTGATAQEVVDAVVDARDDVESAAPAGEGERNGEPSEDFMLYGAGGEELGVLQVAMAPIGDYTAFFFSCTG
jgi:hypothetical protein